MIDDDHEDAPPTRHTLFCYLDPETGLVVERQYAGGRSYVKTLDDPFEEDPGSKPASPIKEQTVQFSSTQAIQPLTPGTATSQRSSPSRPTGTSHSNHSNHQHEGRFNELDEESKQYIIETYVKPLPLTERVYDAISLLERNVGIPTIQVRLDASGVVRGGKNNLVGSIPLEFEPIDLLRKAGEMVNTYI
jgi:hypothetical protein